MKKNHVLRRFISILLCCVMLFGMIPVTTYAEEGTGVITADETTPSTTDEADADLAEVVSDPQDPTEESAEQLTEDPAEEATEAPTEETAEDLTEEAAEESAQEAVKAPTEEAAEESAQEATEETTGAPAEDPAETPSESPAEVPGIDSDDTVTGIPGDGILVGAAPASDTADTDPDGGIMVISEILTKSADDEPVTVTSPGYPNGYDAGLTQEETLTTITFAGAEQLYIRLDDISINGFLYVQTPGDEGTNSYVVTTDTTLSTTPEANYVNSWELSGRMFVVEGNTVNIWMTSEYYEWRGYSIEVGSYYECTYVFTDDDFTENSSAFLFDEISAPATDPTKEGFIFMGWQDEDGVPFNGIALRRNAVFNPIWLEEATAGTQFHKVTDVSQLRLGAHYIIVSSQPDGTSYTLSTDANNGYMLKTRQYNDALYMPLDSANVLTMVNLVLNSATSATVKLRANNDSLLKLGTGKTELATMFNDKGGNISLNVSDSLWSVGNSGRGLRFISNSFEASSSGTGYVYELWTDANTDGLGNARYVEYAPLGLSLTEIDQDEEMLIVYTIGGYSYALTMGSNGTYAVPVTVESASLVNMNGDIITTTAITTDRSNAWTVSGLWENRADKDPKSGMADDSELKVYRNTLIRGDSYLWASTNGLIRTNTSAPVYFYINGSDPTTAEVRLHGDDQSADRYVGWNGKDFYVDGLPFEESITVRIYGPEKDISSFSKYVMLDHLDSLNGLADGTQFLIVLNLGNKGRYALGGNTSSTKDPSTWLFEVADPVEDSDGDLYIYVNNRLPIVFDSHGSFRSDGKYWRFAKYKDEANQSAEDGGIRLAGSGLFYYPQNAPDNKPFDSKGREVCFEYGSDDFIYIRGNGGSSYLGYDPEGKIVGNLPQSDPNRIPIEIYVISTETGVQVQYMDTTGENLMASTKVLDSLTLIRQVADVWRLDGEIVPEGTPDSTHYIFVGWSTDDSHPFLTRDQSCNIYHTEWLYDSDGNRIQTGVDIDGNPKYASISYVKDKARETYQLVGLCQAEQPNTVSLDELSGYIGEDYILYLYPVFAEAGDNYSDVVVAYDVDGTPILGISDWKPDQDKETSYSSEREKWLGSIDVEVYRDGVIWVKSVLYFSYHNDDTADVIIKFIDSDDLRDIYRDDLRPYMLSDDMPIHDQKGHYTIDAVYATQGDSEDGLLYALNYMTAHGGRLDNVQGDEEMIGNGGAVVKVFLTTKYNVAYFLQNPNGGYDLIEKADWNNPFTYTTDGTDSAVNPYRDESMYILVDKDHNTGLFYEDLDTVDGNTTFLLPDSDMGFSRGTYNGFIYFIEDHTYTIPIAKAPTEDIIPAGYILKSLSWMMKDSAMGDLEPVGYSSAYPIIGTEYGTGNTENAYVDVGGLDYTGFAGEDPYTFHLYADIAKPGKLSIGKTVTGNEGDTDKEFTFVVRLTDYPLTGESSDLEFIDGVASFTLKHGEVKTTGDLPEETYFTVSEINDDDYTVTIEVAIKRGEERFPVELTEDSRFTREESDSENNTIIIEGVIDAISAYETVEISFINDKDIPEEVPETPAPAPEPVPEPVPEPEPVESPVTGDRTNMLLWSALVALSACGIIGIVYVVRKKKYSE